MIDESKKDVNYYPIIKSEGNVIKEKMILMSVDGKEREKFLKKLKENFSKTGKYFENANKIINTPISLLLTQVGEENQLNLDKTPVFVVTTSPEKLMQIRGISYEGAMNDPEFYSQFAFWGMISMATIGAITAFSSGPLFLPMIISQISITLFFLWRLARIEKELIRIGTEIEKLLKRNIAKDISYFSSSLKIVESIENEFLNSQKFTNDMITRLSLVENNVRKEDEKQWILIQDVILEYDEIYEMTRKDIKDSNKKNERERKLKEKMGVFASKVELIERLDTKLWLCFSILSVRIMILRNKLMLQENPQYSEKNINKTKERMENYKEKWEKLIKLYRMLEKIKEFEAIDRNIGRERTMLKNSLEKILNGIDVQEMESLVNEAEIFLKEEENEKKDYSLIYWKDELGEHSYSLE